MERFNLFWSLTMFEIKIFNSFNENLRKIWQNLEKDNAEFPFQTFSWNKHWYETIGKSIKNYEIYIVCITVKKTCKLILPLAIFRNFFNVKILLNIGGYHTDYKEPLIDTNYHINKNNIENLWTQINNKLPKYDVINFDKLILKYSHKIDLYNFLQKKYSMTSYQLKFDTEKTEFKMIYKNKEYSEIKRQIRKLQEFGKLTFTISKNKIQDDEFINKMIAQKRERFYFTKVWDSFKVKEHRNLYLNLNNLKDHNVNRHCSALIYNNDIIATHIGITFKNKFYYLMPSFEMAYSKYSPGKILLMYLTKYCFENKFDAIDFTGGNEVYKQKISNKNFKLYDIIYPVSFKGYLYNYILITINFLKKSKLLYFLLSYFYNTLFRKK